MSLRVPAKVFHLTERLVARTPLALQFERFLLHSFVWRHLSGPELTGVFSILLPHYIHTGVDHYLSSTESKLKQVRVYAPLKMSQTPSGNTQTNQSRTNK